tara:strand:+ start:2849 stop:2980 length:132 start_codon:yes stop_codon:yes gene_type:complete
MAQPTDTQHKPSPNISGGANDIYLADNTPTPNTGIYLENNKPV